MTKGTLVIAALALALLAGCGYHMQVLGEHVRPDGVIVGGVAYERAGLIGTDWAVIKTYLCTQDKTECRQHSDHALGSESIGEAAVSGAVAGALIGRGLAEGGDSSVVHGGSAAAGAEVTINRPAVNRPRPRHRDD
ncbi:MAG: hypothetical protein U1C74_16815 [Phenylobacterium sp.]|nr:hypothetical protein [Phenylobacterium sp.]